LDRLDQAIAELTLVDRAEVIDAALLIDELLWRADREIAAGLTPATVALTESSVGHH
jgi:hypothetical protein